MQQFVVPQFIQVEDKILGPITVRQFVILLVFVLIEFVTYKLADFGLFLIISLPLLLFTIVLAFVKINGKPFHFFLLNFIVTVKRSRIRVWSHKENIVYNLQYPKKKEKEKIKEAPTLKQQQVSDLSKVVDTSGKYRK